MCRIFHGWIRYLQPGTRFFCSHVYHFGWFYSPYLECFKQATASYNREIDWPAARPATIALASKLWLASFGHLIGLEAGRPAGFGASHSFLATVNWVTTQPVSKSVIIF